MAFVASAEAVARSEMDRIDPSLTDRFVAIIQFLVSHPDAAAGMRGSRAPSVGSVEYISKQAIAFAQARNPRAPQSPTTVPDEMVSVILVEYFNVAPEQVLRVKREHLLSMGAENMVGELLERYLASVLENEGWIWCSGAMVRAADFIKPPSSAKKLWRLLQVKNRDNSENSSSSAIRVGTEIEKWFRTFSRREGSNWAAFPDETLRPLLSEDGFKMFVVKYLKALVQ